jgi:hypothetical protein
MELQAQQEQPRPQGWRGLLWFGGGCLTSLVIYATVLIIFLFGARLFGWRLGELGIGFAWTMVLQLLAAGITVVNGSRWRRFGAGLAVGGLLLLIAVVTLFVYAFDHTKLTF